MAKVDALESHELDLVKENQRLHHALVVINVEQELPEAPGAKSLNGLTDAKDEF